MKIRLKHKNRKSDSGVQVPDKGEVHDDEEDDGKAAAIRVKEFKITLKLPRIYFTCSYTKYSYHCYHCD